MNAKHKTCIPTSKSTRTYKTRTKAETSKTPSFDTKPPPLLSPNVHCSDPKLAVLTQSSRSGWTIRTAEERQDGTWATRTVLQRSSRAVTVVILPHAIAAAWRILVGVGIVGREEGGGGQPLLGRWAMGDGMQDPDSLSPISSAFLVHGNVDTNHSVLSSSEI